MPHIFSDWQEEYAARGLPTFPVNPLAPDGRKLPGVRGYGKVGLRGSHQIALKFHDKDTNGLACLAGVRRGASHLVLALIDVDARGAEADRLAADVQLIYGPSRFIVRTGNDGRHLYYRWSGEGRKIRPDPSMPIDILGGGVVVLPPSLGAKQPYEIIYGHLDDLCALTKIARAPAPPEADPPPQELGDEEPLPTALRTGLGWMRDGDARNRKLFDIMRHDGRHLPPTLDAFTAHARMTNTEFGEPMGDDEVVMVATKVLKMREAGRLFTSGGVYFSPEVDLDELEKNPWLCSLIMFLTRRNGPDALFWVADGLSRVLGWPIARLSKARRVAIENGWIVQVAPAMGGQPALYRWGPTANRGR
jgi:hypothetical protein